MENINSHILKLSGRAELPEAIEPGTNYHISLEGSIPKVELHDNENGSWDKVYTFKAVKVELLDPKGKTLKLKDTRSSSQVFRARLWKQWSNANSALDFDVWYQYLMLKLIQNADEIAEMYGE